MDKLDKIINIVRNLKEDGMGSGGVSSGPTNSLGSGKIAGTVEAGDTPPVRKKNKYIYGTGFRTLWMQKRNQPK